MSKSAVLKWRDKLKRELQIIRTIDVLQQIAISEFRATEERLKEACRFTEQLKGFFQFYRSRLTPDELYSSSTSRPAIVAVTSDEGFAGALNAHIVAETVRQVQASPDAELIAIGRRGARKLEDAGLRVDREFPGITVPLAYGQVLPLKNYLMREYLQSRIGCAQIIYAKCESFTRQTLRRDELLPFGAAAFQDAGENPNIDPAFVLLEPDAKRIVEYTIGLWFGRKLYEIFWNSKLSETAARAIELNERSEKISRTSEQTRIRHFRAQHEVIDQGIREVFSGIFFAKKLKESRRG